MKKAIDRISGFVALLALALLLFERSQTAVAAKAYPFLRWINLVVVLVFIADIILSLMAARKKLRHLLTHWYDSIVFIPLVYFFFPKENISLSVFFWQAAIVVSVLSRFKKAKGFVESIGLRSAQVMTISFIFLICSGAVLLTLPIATSGGSQTSLVDAFFTSTSAVCVTGLIVKDTAVYFSRWGQVIILCLIQLGGLGIMSFSVLLAIMTGKKMNLSQKAAMQDVLDQNELSGVAQLIKFIFKMTLFFEAAGAAALFLFWFGRFDSPAEAIYHSVFHSVSAFCNAGFSTFSNSLMNFASDTATVLIISGLIIFGGLGFATIKDSVEKIKHQFGRKRKKPRLKVQSKIVIAVSAVLIFTGTAAILFFELSNSQTPDVRTKLLTAFFQSVSTRTAGFNTCDIASLAPATIFLMIILMFIGASPGSTGGGLKTTTFAVLWACMTNGFTKNRNVEIYKRTIPEETISKAVTVLLFYMITLFVIVLLLLTYENFSLSEILFEAVSAVGTVGLSKGITPQLSPVGKILVIILMFFGRLGPLTIGYSLIAHNKKTGYAYAEEKVMIG
ncbi:Trk family potassium uptake protein [candidate division WOR-3 bacterium]|nr:Trk family potassium uptake protein [candidate division WOR-3 bacterium]